MVLKRGQAIRKGTTFLSDMITAREKVNITECVMTESGKKSLPNGINLPAMLAMANMISVMASP